MSLPVVAVIKAIPGKEPALEKLLRKLVEESHQEPGCVTYALHRALSEPGTFVFVEKWQAPADMDAHFQTPHLQEALRLKPELIRQMDVYTLDPMGGGNPAKNKF